MVKDLGKEAVKRTTNTRVRAMNKSIASIVILFFLTMSFRQNAFSNTTTRASATTDLSEISLNQTADMKVVFLGIPQEYVDVNEFVESVSKSVGQFASPNTMTWNLNVSILFHEFPEDVLDSLDTNAYHSKGITYYNVTLLDFLLSQFENLTIPERGYLIVFMWIPDNTTNHSWFYVQERPDLFLGRTDYFNGMPFEYWAFPTSFGGIRRALYFDISDTIEQTSSKLLVTSRVVSLFNNGLTDIFNDLLGSEDPRMIAADTQKYENYQVRIIWLNGTGEPFYPERIKEAFEDLMPWTNWTVTIETRAIDNALTQLIENRTEELSKPVTYLFLLSNGSSISIEASRNVKCDLFADSGEQDPLIRYFFENVKNYFNLKDLEDKSVIPVVFLQLRDDTAFGGTTQAGVSWFLNNTVIIGFQGSTVTATGESGPMFLTHLLRHEIGHWVSLSHHSSNIALGYPKIICSLRSMTNQFCAFCKDARARMSFISYYNATVELLSNDTTKSKALESDLENALQLFYDWKYVEAIDAIVSIYRKASAQDFSWTPFIVIGIIVGALCFILLLKRFSKRSSERKVAFSDS